MSEDPKLPEKDLSTERRERRTELLTRRAHRLLDDLKSVIGDLGKPDAFEEEYGERMKEDEP